MTKADHQLALATAFLEEARRALHCLLGPGSTQRDAAWRARHLDAMAYWARAYQNYRACRLAQGRATCNRWT
jgi:hypothetical protein